MMRWSKLQEFVLENPGYFEASAGKQHLHKDLSEQLRLYSRLLNPEGYSEIENRADTVIRWCAERRKEEEAIVRRMLNELRERHRLLVASLVGGGDGGSVGANEVAAARGGWLAARGSSALILCLLGVVLMAAGAISKHPLGPGLFLCGFIAVGWGAVEAFRQSHRAGVVEEGKATARPPLDRDAHVAFSLEEKWIQIRILQLEKYLEMLRTERPSTGMKEPGAPWQTSQLKGKNHAG